MMCSAELRVDAATSKLQGLEVVMDNLAIIIYVAVTRRSHSLFVETFISIPGRSDTSDLHSLTPWPPLSPRLVQSRFD